MLQSFMTLLFSSPLSLFAEKHDYLGRLPGMSLTEQHLHVLFLTVATLFPSIFNSSTLFLKQSCLSPQPHPLETMEQSRKPLKRHFLLPMTDVFSWLVAGDWVSWAWGWLYGHFYVKHSSQDCRRLSWLHFRRQTEYLLCSTLFKQVLFPFGHPTLFKCHQQDEIWCKETPRPPFRAPVAWGWLARQSPALVLGLMPGPSGPSQARWDSHRLPLFCQHFPPSPSC